MLQTTSHSARVLPLDAWHRARRARMAEFAGYAMPLQYEGIVAEHLWTRAQAGLFDVSHMGQVRLRGPGLDAALEALMPIDLGGLADGAMRYSLLLAEDGGILDDVMATRAGDEILLVVNGATKEADLAHLRARLPDAIAVDHLADRALLALQGPKAADVLTRFLPGLRALPFLHGQAFRFAGIKGWVSRSGYTGEDGFEISLPAACAVQLATWLWCEPEVRPAGLGARDSLRLEAGLPLYGHDLDPGISPIAASLGFAVPKRRRREGGYPGAQRIAAELDKGAAAKRVGLVVDGRQPVRVGARVFDRDEHEAGRVTSGGFSPSLQAPIAMAYVAAPLAVPGTQVSLVQRGKLHRARVVALPFLPHRYARHGG